MKCSGDVRLAELEDEKAYAVATDFGDIVGFIHKKCIENDVGNRCKNRDVC